MDFIFCQEKEQRVSKAVCEANVKKGKCTQDLLKCQKAKTPKATAPRLPDIDILADNPNLNKVRNSITDQTTEREGQLNLFPERKE
jgi:hypothetical protein